MTIKLGLVGTGTVGGGCIDILHNHREDFKRRLGVDMELVRVCSRNLEQAEAHGVSDLFTTDFNDILNDPEIDIEWPEMKGEYKGSASAEGYTLEDGTALNLSDKDQKWLGLKDTFKF